MVNVVAFYPTIRVRIPLKPTVYSVKFVFEKIENKPEEAGVGPFLKNNQIGPIVKHVWKVAVHLCIKFFAMLYKQEPTSWGDTNLHLLLPENTKLRGSITVRLTSGFVLDSSALP